MMRDGMPVARCTVKRLMKRMGLHGVRRGKVVRTTVPDKAVPCPLDRVHRQFKADRPNQLWVSDFTYVSTWQGWQYVAFVIDVYARRIVGWRQSSSMRTDFVLDALEQALFDRRPERTDALIHHSDRGSQHVSIRYSERLAEAGAAVMMGGSYELSPRYLHGDLLCLLAGATYTGYLLIVQRARPESWRDWALQAGFKVPEPKQVVELDTMFAVARAAERVDRALERDLHREHRVLEHRVDAGDRRQVHDVVAALHRFGKRGVVAHVALNQFDVRVLVKPRSGERVATQQVEHHALVVLAEPANQACSDKACASSYEYSWLFHRC